MSTNYLYTVRRERDLASNACQFNRSFLIAVRARADITTRNQDAINALLLGFSIQVLKDKQNSALQDKTSLALFRAFKKAADDREKYLLANPLPNLPEDAC